MSGKGQKIIIASAVVLVVACLVFAMYTLVNFASPLINTQRKIGAEIAKIKEKGEPVTLAELAPPPVPDDQNAAIIYEKAFKIIDTPQGKKDLKIIGEFLSPKNDRNAKLWSQAREAVARNKKIISLVEEAQAKPKCRFSVDWAKGLDAEYPHLAKLRDMTRFFWAHSLINARDGNMDEAINSLRLGIKLTEPVKDERCLIPLLVRIAIARIICRSSYEALSYGNLNEIQAEKLYKAMSEIEYCSDLGKALEGDRAMWISFCQHLRTGNQSSAEKMNPGSSSQYPGRNLGHAIFGAEEVQYLKNMAKQIRNADMSYREATIKGVDKEATDSPKYAHFSAIFSSTYSRPRAARDIAIAELRGMQILLACQAYRDRYQVYPETLSELRSKLGWKLPKDVFSGKDMVYRPLNRGFILYSVGSDLKDNGGHPPKKFGSYNDGDDIVWKMEH